MSRQYLTTIGGYLRQQWRRVVLLTLGGLAAILVVIQTFLIPWGTAPLYTQVDTVMIGGKNPEVATRELEAAYARLPVEIYFGNRDESYKQPTTQTIGIDIKADEQVASAAYSWWLRLVPTSLWWAHAVTPAAKGPNYTYDKAWIAYIESLVGTDPTLSNF